MDMQYLCGTITAAIRNHAGGGVAEFLCTFEQNSAYQGPSHTANAHGLMHRHGQVAKGTTTLAKWALPLEG